MPDTASIGDIGESSSSGMVSPDIPPIPAHTRSHGKAKKTKDREPFYKKRLWSNVSSRRYKRPTKKSHLLAAMFFASNTSVRNELVHVLDALPRLKQLTRKEYADIPLV